MLNHGCYLARKIAIRLEENIIYSISIYGSDCIGHFCGRSLSAITRVIIVNLFLDYLGSAYSTKLYYNN